MNVRLEVNRKSLLIEVGSDERLIDSLRDKLGLCGTKEGCGIGECGACSVLVDQKLVSACLVLTWQVDGCAITTIEGLARAGPAQRITTSVYSGRGGAVRLLHTWNDHGRSGYPQSLPKTDDPTDPGWYRRQSLPLYRLRQNRKGDSQNRPKKGTAKNSLGV